MLIPGGFKTELADAFTKIDLLSFALEALQSQLDTLIFKSSDPVPFE